MGGDDYVVDENGAWNTWSDALAWYRKEVQRLRATQSSGSTPIHPEPPKPAA
jgi:hypothetical protein